MTKKIPESLVTISKNPLPSSIHGRERVDKGMIKRFWQAFSTSRQTSTNEMDSRLEYLFWRIWSSRKILNHTDITALDSLVSRIMASEPLQPSPPSRLNQAGFASSMSNVPAPARDVPDNDPAKTQNPIKAKSVPHHGTPTTLHPILKKPNTAPSEAHKTTRLLLQNPGGESITQNPANSPTSPERVSTIRQTSKKGTTFSAARPTRAGRRRPVFNRRKSSQMSIPKASPLPRERGADIKREDSSEPMFDVDDDLSADPGPLRTTERKRSKDATWTSIEQVSPPLDVPGTIASATASIADKISVSSQKEPAVTPAVLELADQQDPILPPGIETVSTDPTARIPGTPHTECPGHSSYDDLFGRDATYKPITPMNAPVAKNVPVPAETPVANALDINADVTLLPSRVRQQNPPEPPQLPSIPPWRRPGFVPSPVRQNTDPTSQPSSKPLVPKDFRKQWLDLLEEVEKIREQEKDFEDVEATSSQAQPSIQPSTQPSEQPSTQPSTRPSNVSMSLRAKGKQRMEEDPDAIMEIDDDWQEPEMDY